ncbi:hypothetical protein BKA25_001615 [Actinoalloteichus hymeniacidonis]|uniref:Uncharacterized protein n=1 Tax=Actinoalloteichus hymeniacidonis TaxID=340345 RepID=A0AAC9HSJ1_9PSEU|nr:hypothetical protein TL08_19185 [Actinoalloteichus hymeniacidonis]MBB5907299.1 hypothetical protein [Actinoalloteichus hymeniacidonis]
MIRVHPGRFPHPDAVAAPTGSARPVGISARAVTRPAPQSLSARRGVR